MLYIRTLRSHHFTPRVWGPVIPTITEIQIKRDSISVTYDTLQVTGKAVLSGTISYRFPLWPGLIDKKLSFLYLERLYGAINVSGGAGWDNPTDFFKFDRNDYLISYGAEVRLEGQLFSNLPLAIKHAG